MIKQRMGGGIAGLLEADRFRLAIAKWARGYSIRYRYALAPKPTVMDALADLRRWSASYWTAPQPVPTLGPLAAEKKTLKESLS